MKQYLNWPIAIFFTLFLASFLVFAQETPPPVPPVDSTQDFLKLLIESIGGMKGMSTLAIVGVVIQILIKFMSLPVFGQIFKTLDGSMKLLIVSGLTMALGPITMVSAQGLTWSAALVHSATLTAVMVFMNQLWQHFGPKAVETAAKK